MHRQDGPTSGVDHYSRGLSFYSRGQHEAALAELGQVPSSAGLTGQMARFYRGMSYRALGLKGLQEGRFAQAERNLRTAMQTLGQEAGLSSFLAAVYAKVGRLDRCLHHSEQAMEARPDNARVARELAQAQWRCGRRAEAYMTLTAAMRRLGADCQLHLQMGLFQAAEDRLDEARQSFLSALEADCESADAHHYLGLAEAARGDARSAAREFQRALALRGEDLLVAYQLSLAARAAKEQGVTVQVRLPEPSGGAASGSQVLARCVAADPDIVEALLGLPDSDADEEIFSTVLTVLRTALAWHPTFADLRLACGRVLRRLGRLTEAMEETQEAIRVNSRYVQALLEAAELGAQLDQVDLAADYVTRAIEHGADWPDVHCLAGELMVRCNRMAQARNHLQRAMQLNESYARASRAYALLAA